MVPESVNSPKYQKLAEQLSEQIRSGVYKDNQKLPSVRSLSTQMNLSISSVVAAYRKLEAEGLLEARYKSGYYVKPQSVSHSKRLNPEPGQIIPTSVTSSQLISDLISSASNTQLQQFGLASPSRHSPSGEQLLKSYAKLIRQKRTDLQMSTELQGSIKLRQQVAKHLAEAGMMTSPDNIIITTGCQSAILLCLKACTKQDDVVVISSPAYYRTIQLLEALNLRVIEVPCHPITGIELDTLEEIFDQWSVKAVIVTPNFGNPLGDCMPDEHKKRMLDLAGHYEVIIIEDDVFGDLGYQNPRPKALKAIDSKATVLYCSSASKTISPQLKVGWIVTDRFLKPILHQFILMGLSPPALNQKVLADYFTYNNYLQHVKAISTEYQKNLAKALAIIEDSFPKGTHCSNPKGGFVLWVELPQSFDTTRLYYEAKNKGILIAPGELFSSNPKQYSHCFRIEFAQLWSSERMDALKRLGSILNNQID